MKNYYRFVLVTLSLMFFGTVSGQTGSFSGLIFYDYTASSASSAIDGFGLSRAYFTYENKISDAIKYKFQTDVDYTNVPMNLYLKNAYVDWSTKFGKLTFGLQGMNTFSVQEKTWGLRYIEKSPMDLYKWASSADMGVGYSHTFLEKLHLSVLLVNGAGYKSAETDSYKKESIQVFIGEQALAGHSGSNVGGILTYEPYDYSTGGGTLTKESKLIAGLFGGMATDRFRAGGEFERYYKNGPDIVGQLFSFYGNVHVLPAFDLFGRFDFADPDLDTDKDGQSYLILGLSYSPAKGLTIAPNFRTVMYQDGTDPDKVFKLNFEFKG